MSDEIRLVSELTSDTYKNSVGNAITVIRIEKEIVMTAKEIAKLYGVSRANITMKLTAFFRTKKFVKKEVSKVLAHRADDGKLYETRYYNQDVILEIGKHIKSQEVENLRRWING
ncbi:hypothetical protein FACS189431_8610 [Alphaproteobacteria bacterium]|nr:hypothetical protein FACS189431_8610 [Alphaproteobacteria bacterium]